MFLRWCALFGLLQLTAIARADGAMQLGDRTLFRVGAEKPGYCGAGSADDECDQLEAKVLSGYGYLRGQLLGGVTSSNAKRDRTTGLVALRIAVASGALPGGDMTAGAFDGALDTAALRRVRMTLFDAKGLFICHDAQSGELVTPLTGMFSRECLPNAAMAFDAGVGAVQWDVSRGHVAMEWLHAGPAWELLGNGLGQAHLLRSIMLALPFDLRSTLHGGAPSDRTSLGAGLRLGALYRTPQWETRLDVQQRSALAGGAGIRHDNQVQAELRLLHNFFLTDALIMQVGVSLRGVWAQRPQDAFIVWADTDQRWLGFAGLYLGWISAPPSI